MGSHWTFSIYLLANPGHIYFWISVSCPCHWLIYKQNKANLTVRNWALVKVLDIFSRRGHVVMRRSSSDLKFTQTVEDTIYFWCYYRTSTNIQSAFMHAGWIARICWRSNSRCSCGLTIILNMIEWNEHLFVFTVLLAWHGLCSYSRLSLKSEVNKPEGSEGMTDFETPTHL